jgi:hypothetical protein
LRHFYLIYISKALENALEKDPPAGGVGVGGINGTNTGPGDGVEGDILVPPTDASLDFGGINFFKGICIFIINIKKA